MVTEDGEDEKKLNEGETAEERDIRGRMTRQMKQYVVNIYESCKYYYKYITRIYIF